MLWFYANNDNYRSDMIWLYEFAAFQILHGKKCFLNSRRKIDSSVSENSNANLIHQHNGIETSTMMRLSFLFSG